MYRSLWVMSHVSTITSMYTIADVHLFVSNSEKKLQGILLHSTMNLKQNTLNIKCYYFNTSSYIRNYHVVCRITCMSYMPKKEAFWSRDYQRLTEHKINTNLHKHTWLLYMLHTVQLKIFVLLIFAASPHGNYINITYIATCCDRQYGTVQGLDTWMRWHSQKRQQSWMSLLLGDGQRLSHVQRCLDCRS